MAKVWVIRRADGMYAVDVRRPPRWSRDIAHARRFRDEMLAHGAIRLLHRQPAMPKIGMEVIELDE